MGRVAVVSSVTAVLTVIGVVGIDWSDAALGDPARALSMGPLEALVADQANYLPPFSILELVVTVATSLATVAAGLEVWKRRPQHATGQMMVAAGLLSLACLVRRSDVPLLFTAGVVLTNLAIPIVVHLVLGYPSGHLRRTWERVFVGLCWLLATVGVVSEWLFFDPRIAFIEAGSTSQNLLLIDHRPELAHTIQLTVGATMLVFAVMLACTVLARWIAGTRTYRSDFTPIVLSTLIGFGVLAFALFATVQLRVLPGDWVLRFRNPCVVLLPFVFIVIARRYRHTHGAVHSALTELGSTPVTDGFLESLRRVVRDPTLELWTYDNVADTYSDSSGGRRCLEPVPRGRRVTLVDWAGNRVGAVLHDKTLMAQREVRAAVRVAAGLALEHERMQSELQQRLIEVRQSRARIVHAGDIHRQRIGRDLHDGAQQLLVTAILQLGRAQQSVDSDDLRIHLDAGVVAARTALHGLRELARGVYPATLTDYGLVAALNSLAERSALPLELASSLDERPCGASELAAYYIAAEAITNACKHSGAEFVHITIERRGAELVVTIRDNGCGGATVSRGGGLDGLIDRAGAVGGSLRMESPAGVGTTLVAMLPFNDEEDRK
ncbi:sensor histidine kinase [Nocardia sp. NPDC058666]|uniref:sensor histidine kinase n=1 Tax=Nocardia sp. NPDC058666 TaxID=3346587 RepID=UPI0036683D8E